MHIPLLPNIRHVSMHIALVLNYFYFRQQSGGTRVIFLLIYDKKIQIAICFKTFVIEFMKVL